MLPIRHYYQYRIRKKLLVNSLHNLFYAIWCAMKNLQFLLVNSSYNRKRGKKIPYTSKAVKCGTIMEFPLNPTSNLHFMLTKTAVNKNCKQHNSVNFTSFWLSDSLFQKSILSFISNTHTTFIKFLLTNTIHPLLYIQ